MVFQEGYLSRDVKRRSKQGARTAPGLGAGKGVPWRGDSIEKMERSVWLEGKVPGEVHKTGGLFTDNAESGIRNLKEFRLYY